MNRKRRQEEQITAPDAKKRRKLDHDYELRKLRESTLGGRIIRLMHDARASAKKRGKKGRPEAAIYELKSAEIEELWRKQDGCCAISGAPLTTTPGVLCVSPDRLDDKRGYSINNLRLVGRGFNNGSKPTKAGAFAPIKWTPEKFDGLRHNFGRPPTASEIKEVKKEVERARSSPSQVSPIKGKKYRKEKM